MLLSDISVKRPVVAIVLSLLLCVFGLVSFSQLPVREMPDVENPVVTITTRYSGVAASIIDSQITSVIEDQLTGISGIDKLESVSRPGMSRTTVTFEMDYPLTEGLSDVRDAVARAQNRLPDQADNPIVSKDNGSGEPSIYLNLNSTLLDRQELTDYANRILIDRLSLVSGVSSVELSGALNQVMYVELDPIQMAGRGITPSDIVSALNRENIEQPGGEIRNDATSMSVRTDRLYNQSVDFEYLQINNDGRQPIYLRDVARIFVGAENENSTYKSDGILNLSLGIVTQLDANPLDVAKDITQEVENFQEFLPADTELYIDYDSTVFIEQAVTEVYQTLAMTGALVVLILYVFLGQARITLIPAVTVPVSLIAAFIAAQSFGFSVNLITLMALILAIGLVVDDAIVVVENIYHHIEQGQPPLLAAYYGTREVGFAVIATTLVLVMVFLPIAYMDGMVGKIFTEFAVLLSVAVLFSSLIALTLTPVLGSKLLKGKSRPNPITSAVDKAFAWLLPRYQHLLRWVIGWKTLAPSILVLCIVGSAYLAQQVPAQLAPEEDRGVVFIFVKGAEGTSYDRMNHNMEAVEQRLMPLLGQGVIRSFNMQAPAFGGRAGDNTGFIIVQLEDWTQRTMSAQQAMAMLNKQLTGMPDIFFRVLPPGFRGGSSEAIQFVLGGPDYSRINEWAEKLMLEAEQLPAIESLELSYSEKTPELVVSIDRARAAELGVSISEVSTTLEVMLGGRTETTYVDRGEEYDVYLRGSERNFNNANDLSKIYLRANNGTLLTLDSVAQVEEVASSRRLERLNKQRAITLKGNVASGHTLGQALDGLEALAVEMLPNDISIDYNGESKDFRDNQSNTVLVFGLALLVAYLVLAAQFESFINPLVVMFTVPMGLLGGLAGLMIMGESLNIYSQIGMLMLIGMVTKNGILIVEYANQLRDRGIDFNEAIVQASSRRLRPILMTAFTTIAGSIPLLLSTGAGAESRMAVGVVILFGMAFSTVVTLVVIPAIYQLLARHTHSPGFVSEQLAKLHSQQEQVQQEQSQQEQAKHDRPSPAMD
ncbi:efflux RND transporter permease subunit [Aliagarivorans taiwanensis]|uniref:efflux RND transporter permease subunit n=1 Tax=Aliagarivorans taiwanensis TaxID=561966 RepID=UPI00040DD0C4|nr:efflux RND transporter permease subunit [Aliagarivorans taiwanensis]